MTDQIWSLDLAGKGSLTAPAGIRQELRYHKVAELLAILAENFGQMHDREALGRALWPDAARVERLVNVRQSLFQARLLLGENLQTTRRTCWVTCMIQVESARGLQSISVTPQAAGAEGGRQDKVPQPTAATLALFAQDPEQGLRLLPIDMRKLVEAWQAQPYLVGWQEWIQFWGAMCDFAEKVTGPNLRMEKLQVGALANGNARLLAQTTFWGGASAIAGGQYRRAEAICARARRANNVHEGDIQRALASVEAHLLLHQGNGEEAIQRLARLEWPDRLSRARNEGLLALYLAIEGRYREAERLLLMSAPGVQEMEGGHEVPTRKLALAFIDTADLRSSSFSRAEDLAESYRATSDHHLELYTRELLWRRAKERNRPSMAHLHISRMKALRRSIGLALTEWDRVRLKPTL